MPVFVILFRISTNFYTQEKPQSVYLQETNIKSTIMNNYQNAVSKMTTIAGPSVPCFFSRQP